MARAAKVDPSVGGAPWWAYRRPPVAQPARPDAGGRRGGAPRGNGHGAPATTPETGDQPETTDPKRPAIPRPTAIYGPYGQSAFIVAASLVAATIVGTRLLGNDAIGLWLLPVAGIFAAVSFG